MPCISLTASGLSVVGLSGSTIQPSAHLNAAGRSFGGWKREAVMSGAAVLSWIQMTIGPTGSRQSTNRTGRCVRVSSEVSRCSERPRFSSASTFTRSRGCADYGLWRAFRLPAKSEPALSPKPRPFWRHIWRPVSRSVPALQRPCRLKLLTPRFPPLLAYITMATCPDLAQSGGE